MRERVKLLGSILIGFCFDHTKLQTWVGSMMGKKAHRMASLDLISPWSEPHASDC